jgi:trimeric autotransporter adhesin
VPFLGTRGAGSNRAFGYAGAAKPNQVTGLTATDFGTARAFNNGRIDLSWTAPANNGATISGYLIQRSTDNVTYSTLVASTGTTATTYSDTSLTSSQIYYYKVSAINAAGTSDASAAANATATTVPQAPTVTATNVGTGRAYNNGAATITATGANGGKAISSYLATSSPSSLTGSSGSSPITVTGLASNTLYSFSVTASNANGTSTASTTNNITATTVPQAPTIGTAADGGTGTTATVTYTAGATGGAAVSVYTATSSPGSVTGTGASPITVSGLTAGTAYTFTVTATNANGTSTASAASNSVTPLVPTAFESIATFTGNGTASTYTFSSIPNTYKALQIRMTAFAGGSAGGYYVGLRANGDTGSNYTVYYVTANESTNSASQSSSQTSLITNVNGGLGLVAGGSYPDVTIIDVLDYASTTKRKTFSMLSGQDRNSVGGLSITTGLWVDTSAINSITIFNQGSQVFNAGTTIALYGIKG